MPTDRPILPDPIRLRGALRESRVSVTELARTGKLNRSTVSDYLNERAPLGKLATAKLLTALELLGVKLDGPPTRPRTRAPKLVVGAMELYRLLDVCPATGRKLRLAGELPPPIDLGGGIEKWNVERVREWLAAKQREAERAAR